jgi:hypothetical protein
MTDTESDQPNEFGFGGGATAPEPQPETKPTDEVDGGSVAVPAGDITGAVSDAIDDLTHSDDDAEPESR